MTGSSAVRLRVLVAVCTSEGQVASAFACADRVDAVRLRGDLEPAWPGYTVRVCTPGWAVASVLDELAEDLHAMAAGPDDPRRHDGLVAAAALVRERADRMRRWSL